MTVTSTLIAPFAGQTFQGTPSGTTYTANNAAVIANVLPIDIAVLIESGCTYQNTATAAATVALAAATAAQNTANSDVSKSVGGGTQSRYINGIPTLWSRTPLPNNYSETAGGTSRLMYQNPYAMHDMVAVFENYSAGNMPEDSTTATSPITVTAALEYPANTLFPIHVGGKSSFVIQPGGDVKSDPLGIDLPAGAQFWVRTYIQLAFPPTSPAATALGSGGTLTAATYYYKITALCGDQGESGPSSEVSATVVANGSVALSWSHAATTPAQTGINVYRSTASGTEVLLTTLPGWTSSFTDTGQFTPGTATPPSAQVLWAVGGLDNTARTGEGTNLTHAGGTGGNYTTSSGTSWMSSTANQNVYGPSAIIGSPDQGFDVPVVGIFGDSIAAGTGDLADYGFLARACVANNIPYLYAPRGGDIMASMANAGATELRILKASDATDAICEYGTNDYIVGSNTLASLQASAIVAWQRLAKRALRVWQTTLIPRSQSLDNFVTATNQLPSCANVNGATNATPIVITSNQYTFAPIFTDGTPVTVMGVGGNTAANGNYFAKVTGYSNPNFALYHDQALTNPVVGNGSFTSGGLHSRVYVEAIRTGFNDWVRAGAPLASAASLTAVAVGTAGALVAGQAGHPLTGYFDAASAVEVNTSNVLTQDGGLWITNSTANYYTLEGTHPATPGHILMQAKINTALFIAP